MPACSEVDEILQVGVWPGWLVARTTTFALLSHVGGENGGIRETFGDFLGISP